ncbi:UNVERIFIED_CONTAM: hypothetical protein K2H54_051197 [Gekko kuhli]
MLAMRPSYHMNWSIVGVMTPIELALDSSSETSEKPEEPETWPGMLPLRILQLELLPQNLSLRSLLLEYLHQNSPLSLQVQVQVQGQLSTGPLPCSQGHPNPPPASRRSRGSGLMLRQPSRDAVQLVLHLLGQTTVPVDVILCRNLAPVEPGQDEPQVLVPEQVELIPSQPI